MARLASVGRVARAVGGAGRGAPRLRDRRPSVGAAASCGADSHGLAKNVNSAPTCSGRISRPWNSAASTLEAPTTNAAPTTRSRPASDSSSVSSATAGTSVDAGGQPAEHPAGADLDEQVDVLGGQRHRLA